jgi:hypothetical protein
MKLEADKPRYITAKPKSSSGEVILNRGKEREE